MFNDLKVSTSIEGQVSQYFAQQYPTFIAFLKEYYAFLETNGNPLDIIGNVGDLINIDTYTGVSTYGILSDDITSTSTEIEVYEHGVYPPTDGLLKIDDEVILYKRCTLVGSGETARTKFIGCTRGYTYNDLDLDGKLTSNVPTVAAPHAANSRAVNQTFAFFLFILERIRGNYLIDFPKNVLQDNIETINIDTVLKHIKDFYLSKGTPKSISFYFKFLYQEVASITNYRDLLMASSDAIYQNKEIIRIETLDNYNLGTLADNGAILVQGVKEFPVQTVENVFSYASQIFELEIANGKNIIPTNFTKVVTTVREIQGNYYVYVDSTYNFPDEGELRIGDKIYSYIDRELNYFVLPLEGNPTLKISVDDVVYDVSTLARVKELNGPILEGSYFVIYAGVSDFEIINNTTYYQRGDLGFVTNLVDETNLLVTNWTFNDITPISLNQDIIAGITQVYTDSESVYVYTSGLPYYSIDPNGTYLETNSIDIKDARIFKKFPKQFKKSVESQQISTPPNNVVGILRDGSYVHNWKSEFRIIRGGLTSIDVVESGDNFSIDQPPELLVERPFLNAIGSLSVTQSTTIVSEANEVYTVNGISEFGYGARFVVTRNAGGSVDNVTVVDELPGNDYAANVEVKLLGSLVGGVDSDDDIILNVDSVWSGVPAEASLIVKGQVKEVYIKSSGSGYPSKTTTISVIKDPTDTTFTGKFFRDAVLTPVVVDGKITKVRIIDPGEGYTKPPTVSITPVVNIDNRADIELQVGGPVTSVSISNAGTNYRSNPSIELKKGSGASGILSIENGKIIGASIVSGGSDYNCRPLVRITDSAVNGGFGAVAIANWNSVSKQVEGIEILNGGINYNETSTVIDIFEPGSGLLLNSNVKYWTQVNNTNPDLINLIRNDTGAFYTDPTGILTDDEGNQTFLRSYSILGAPQKLNIFDPGTGDRIQVNLSDSQNHSPIIGWALDGAPIYGPYGYLNPQDPDSGIRKMRSGYKKINVANLPAERRNSQADGGLLTEYSIGEFEQDYIWTAKNADLDVNNGRFGKTPEYPNGVYAYFLTAELNSPTQGFPYFVGSKFAGTVDMEFNNKSFASIENIPNLRRYLRFNANIAPRPIDAGFFEVSSIPTSTEASLDFVEVSSPGSNYKLGDVVNFNNDGTKGFDAAAYISVLQGRSVSAVSKSTYDYLEYTDDIGNFDAGSTIKTTNGYQADIYSIDTVNERIYLENVTGTPPNPQNKESFYNTNLTIDSTSISELIGADVSTIVVSQQQKTAQLNESSGISATTTTFLIDNLLNATISDFTPSQGNPVYIKIDNEIIKVIAVQGANRLLVARGIASTESTHANNASIKILDNVPVYDSSKYNVGDYIQIGTEKMRVVDILVAKNPNNQVSAVKIENTEGTQGGIQYYLYFNNELQNNGGNTQTTLTISAEGDIVDVVYTPTATAYTSNPIVSVSTNSALDAAGNVQNIVANVELLATTYNHTLVVEREVLDTSLADHVARSEVDRLFFSTATVTYYDENRILSKLNANDNGLVIRDEVTISAATKITESFDIYQTNLSNLQLSTGQLFNAAYPNGLVLYEGSKYEFNVSYTNNSYKPIDVKFYTSTDANTKKEYFDIEIIKVYDTSGRLEKFTLSPKDSDLTNLAMEVINLDNSNVTIIALNILAEPINGTYSVVNSGSGFFEVYTGTDPDPNGDLLSQYNQNTIKYTTTSETATGPINSVTLTNGGVNYEQVPRISSITTENGSGAILEAVSSNIGTISSVKAINSGYGYSPDPTQKPTLVFPTIVQLKNNFTVDRVEVSDGGSGYLFQPRIIVTGGGLIDESLNHAEFSANVVGQAIESINVIRPGTKYASSPTLTAEKYYYVSFISGEDISFNINFKEYFQENDAVKIRAYYFANAGDEATNTYSYVDSNLMYAYLGNVSLKVRSQGGSVNLQPLDQSNWSDDITNIITTPATGLYFEVINLERNALLTAIVIKSPFSESEKINVIRNIGNSSVVVGKGEVSTINGWQENNSILRIVNLTTKILENDEIVGLNTLALGIVDRVFVVETSAKLDAIVQTPKRFLGESSFLGSNALKIQDSNRYQKFAYQIGVQTPFVEWKENYLNALHPAGYKVFSKTEIISSPDTSILSENFRPVDDPSTNYDERNLIKGVNSITTVGTTAAELVQLRRKYNFLVAKNEPNKFDSVLVENKLLTDVLNIKTAIVGVFDDISDQFDGVKTLFELKVVDPVTPTLNGFTNYIVDYEVDQMVVLLDNIVQTYGTSWEVIDADKVIIFTAQENSGEQMPGGERLSYRQFNEANAIYTMNQNSILAGDTFDLNQQDGSVWPAGIFSSIDNNNYMVFVDGALQENANFTISAGGGSPTIQFPGETLPIGTQISVRYSSAFIKNELTNGVVNAGTPVTLSNVSSNPSSKQDYFVFVDGVIISPDDYELDSNKYPVFDYGFNYDTLQIFIDINGVSLIESYHDISDNNYTYKIEDGQLEIPLGFTINPEQYIVDIAGIVQTPYVVYNTRSSGVRKIRFFEAPTRYILPDAAPDRTEIGRQFIGLLYERQDPEGITTTPNYQFDDVSISRLHVKEGFENFVTGDYINTSTSSALIKNKSEDIITKSISIGVTNYSLAAGATVDITLTSQLRIAVGDRVQFNPALGLVSNASDELEITAIVGNVVTLTNIGSTTLTLNLPSNGNLKFIHREFIVIQIETTAPDRDDAFTQGDTLESGIISSLRTGTSSLLNEPYGVLENDTTIDVDDASGFTLNDYLVINEVEIVKITNISSNTLTVDRGQLRTEAVNHADNKVVEKIIPYTITVSSFQRGFDGDKTVFELKEKGLRVNIATDKDIFVIVNGILQKKGANDSYVINILGTSPNEYSVLTFTEAPPEGAPFNVFYLGEVKALKDMAPLFNGTDRAFNLINPTNDEVFSLVSKSRPEANISANLLLFIDGSLQIPSTEEVGRVAAYPSTLAAYKLFGSIVEFSAPPKNGATFEGYIFVGSNDDFEEIDVDPPVERGDIIIQSNERRERAVNLIVSSDKLSVGSSFGQINNVSNASRPQLLDGSNGYWMTDLVQSADIRETLRARRTLKSNILRFTNTPYPLSSPTLITTPITTLKISNISPDFPTSTDINAFISITLAENSSFPQRRVNCIYSDFAVRNELNTTDYTFTSSEVDLANDTIQVTSGTGTFESHGMTTGTIITYNNQSNPDFGGLTSGEQYYVKVIDQHTIKLASNKYNLDNEVYVNISANATGTHQIVAPDMDTISNLTFGFDLKFDQIVRLASTADNDTFGTLTTASAGEIGTLFILDSGTGFANGITNGVELLPLEPGDPGQNGTVNVTVEFGVVTSVEVVNRGSDYIDGQELRLNGFNNVKLRVSSIDSKIFYDSGTKTATVVGYTAGETLEGSSTTTRYLYVKLDDPLNPITTYAADPNAGTIVTCRNIAHQVLDDDLMIDFQTISYNDLITYDF